jgi:hypothetical protein
MGELSMIALHGKVVNDHSDSMEARDSARVDDVGMRFQNVERKGNGVKIESRDKNSKHDGIEEE